MGKLLDKAIVFAINAHKGQFRKGTDIPYILHPLEAATIVGTMTTDDEIIVGAVLHDVVEDTNTTIEEIRKLFGERVAEFVASESEDKRESFENCGIPTVVDEDGDTFFSYIRSKIDYNYYNCEFLVKLYLLCCAYTDEETYLRMEENLYEEMFEDSEYISSFDGKIPFNPTPKIFKDIEKYDYCIEMTEQKDGCYGCWKLIIYDKKSRIKVATFC